MSTVTLDEIQSFLQDYVGKAMRDQGRDVPSSLPDDTDLLLAGYIDSLGLLELMTALQDRFGSEIDFEKLDPEQMTIIGPLKKFVAEQLAAR
jgi:acyl carrier protein